MLHGLLSFVPVRQDVNPVYTPVQQLCCGLVGSMTRHSCSEVSDDTERGLIGYSRDRTEVGFDAVNVELHPSDFQLPILNVRQSLWPTLRSRYRRQQRPDFLLDSAALMLKPFKRQKQIPAIQILADKILLDVLQIEFLQFSQDQWHQVFVRQVLIRTSLFRAAVQP